LWAITVYVEPELFRKEPNRVGAMLGFLKDSLDVALHDDKGRPVLGLRDYAVDLVAARTKLSPSDAERLQEAVALEAAAAGAVGTFTELVDTVYQFARSEGLTTDEVDTSGWSQWSRL